LVQSTEKTAEKASRLTNQITARTASRPVAAASETWAMPLTSTAKISGTTVIRSALSQSPPRGSIPSMMRGAPRPAIGGRQRSDEEAQSERDHHLDAQGSKEFQGGRRSTLTCRRSGPREGPSASGVVRPSGSGSGLRGRRARSRRRS
jgi:hypothetical protein